MFLLDSEEIAFPDPALYDFEGGLLAMGGDLSPERIWFAYQNGIFPWFNPEDDILWWCPDPRFVLLPEDLKISKSMKKILREGKFTFTNIPDGNYEINVRGLNYFTKESFYLNKNRNLILNLDNLHSTVAVSMDSMVKDNSNDSQQSFAMILDNFNTGFKQ